MSNDVVVIVFGLDNDMFYEENEEGTDPSSRQTRRDTVVGRSRWQAWWPSRAGERNCAPLCPLCGQGD